MQQKLGYIEGVRGLAAVTVCVYHFLSLFLSAFYSNGAVSRNLAERTIATSPMNILISGNFPVCLFFRDERLCLEP
jgi:peptidoglycan/LPS O-acetylase OafA/YrhL